MEILKVTNLVKHYRDVEAVKGISFSISAGEIVGLLGPNGAGKTTTIQMVLGLLEPTSGEIEILGKSLKTHRYEILQQINYAATYSALPQNLSVRENLTFFSLLYNTPNADKRLAELFREFNLEKFINTRSGLLSSGEQTRLSLAKAFINKPKMLLLDEPTASLDPDIADRVRTHIREEAQTHGTALLWTSHNMREMEAICDRILFLSRGTIIAKGTPEELITTFGKKDLEETFIAISRGHE